MFNPGLKIGQTISNEYLIAIFKCGNMGGMRRSKTTNTLVLISDYTKGIYHDKWIGGILHYTGMGKNGDQDINWAQNATLANYGKNDVDMHLFEVMDAGEYVYCGRIELVTQPYIDIQPGEDGNNRKVWIFPIRPVPENDVKKPQMYVFVDMADYIAHGKNVDAEYNRIRTAVNKAKKAPVISQAAPVILPEPAVVIPEGIVGKTIKHKTFGVGTVTEARGTVLVVDFVTEGEKKLGYEFCMKNKLIEPVMRQ